MGRRKKPENYVSVFQTPVDTDLAAFDIYFLGLGAFELPELMIQNVPRVLCYNAAKLIHRVTDFLLNDAKLTGELSWEEIGMKLNGADQVIRFIPFVDPQKYDKLEFVCLDSLPEGYDHGA